MLAGLDTVGFSFPIEPEHDTKGCTVSIAGYRTEGEAVRYRRQLPRGGFLGTGIGGMAWVEASLPKRVGEDNVDGLGVVDAMDVLRDLWVEACTFVTPTVKVVVEKGVGPQAAGSWDRDGRVWDQAKVKRLDIARDFDQVHQMNALLDGLAGVPRSSTAKVRRYADAASNRAETLRVGPKSAWSGTLYDKHAETRGLCAAGRLRFEARCRSEFLEGQAARKALGGTVVSEVRNVTQDRIDQLCRERFAAAGFDREVKSADQFTARVLESDLTPNAKRRLLGYVAARSLGVDLGYSRNTEAKYRKLAKGLGITLGVDPETSVVLDLDAGLCRVLCDHERSDADGSDLGGSAGPVVEDAGGVVGGVGPVAELPDSHVGTVGR